MSCVAWLSVVMPLLSLMLGCEESHYALNAVETLAAAGATGSGGEGAAECGGVAGPPLCEQVPRLDSVVLDGTLDCGARLQTLSGGATLNGSAAQPVALALAWTPAGVYWFVDVDDPSIDAPENEQVTDPAYCGDAVELHLDDDGQYRNPPAYDDPGTIHIVVPRGSKVPAGSFRGNVALGPTDPKQIVVTERSGGWSVEALVTAAELGLANWTLESGGKIGFTLAVDYGSRTDQPGAGECQPPIVRAEQWFMSAPDPTAPCGGQPFCDVDTFCNPVLR